MRPVFGIGRLLICMTLISDYSSSVLIHDDNLIHSEFCKEYQDMEESTRLHHTTEELEDIGFGEKLCTHIGNKLYEDVARCYFIIHIRMTVASLVPGEGSFHIYGQKCKCYDRMGNQLPDFCFKRRSMERINNAYVLRPRGQDPTDINIDRDTLLYADDMLYPMKVQTS